MKTVTSIGSLLVLALAACAEGSPPDDGLFDAGASAEDTGSSVVILGSSGNVDAGVVTTGVDIPTGTTPPASEDAGAAASPADFDAGSGDFGGFDAGAGGGFSFDAGGADDGFDAGFGGFGFDAGSDDGFDAGGFGGFGFDAGGGGGGSTCEGYASPDTFADCYCEAQDPSECQANGCYNGYFCDTNDLKCKSYEPSSCL